MARKGGKVADVARKQLENTTGKKVISPLNAKELGGKDENKQIEE